MMKLPFLKVKLVDANVKAIYQCTSLTELNAFVKTVYQRCPNMNTGSRLIIEDKQHYAWSVLLWIQNINVN
jgi:hypothetical protein